MEFHLGQTVEAEESLSLEFKEARGNNPVNSIGKTVDEYVVAYLNTKGGSVYWGIRDDDRAVVGVELRHDERDLLRQVVGQKIAAIAPPVPPSSYDLPLHPVSTEGAEAEKTQDLFVVEVVVDSPEEGGLYLTGSGEAYKKTLGGKQKLSGSELILALLDQLQQKERALANDKSGGGPNVNDLAPSVVRRSEHAGPLLRNARVLWIDDNPSYTIHERTTLSTLDISVDVATSNEEALMVLDRLEPDLIVSDIKRGENQTAGLELLPILGSKTIAIPLIYYVAKLDPSRPKPQGSFGITNKPSELFHLIFDVLERR